MPSSPRALMLLMAVTLILSAMGCAAKDKHVFVSTVHQPTTLTLLDVYQEQSVWEMDIPVNHKLVVNFENNTSEGVSASGTAPSWANWELYRSDDQPTDTGRARKGTLIQSDKVDLTGMRVRMQVSYRPAPEMPGSMNAAPVPVVETAESVAAEAAAEAKAQVEVMDEAPVEEAAVEEAAEVTEEAADVVEEAAEEAEEAVAEVAEEAVEAEAAEVVEEAAEAVPVNDATK
jgi:hypothetical protein